MLKNSAIFLVLVLVLLSGCTGLRQKPPAKNYFDLNIALSALDTPMSYQHRSDPVLPAQNLSDADMTGKGATLLVKELLISPAFDSHAFVYRVSKDTYRTDFYNEFITYPARLITDEFTENLCGTALFAYPLTHQKQTIQYRLSGKITKLYGDFQSPETPKAVLEIRLTLEQNQKNKFAAVLNKTYYFDKPVAAAGPAKLVDGWKKGLESILARFIADYESIPQTGPVAAPLK